MTKLEEEELYYERFFESLTTMDEGMLQTVVDTLNNNKTVGKALVNQVRIMNKSLISSKKKYDKLKGIISQKAPNNQLLSNRMKVVEQLYNELMAKNKKGQTVLEQMKEIADKISARKADDTSFANDTYASINAEAKAATAKAKTEMGNV